MNAKQLRAKSAQELQEELSSLLKAHFSLRMQQATQQLTNTSELGKTRRTVARVRTILAEKARRA
jgi:large subunit ribosomal protein L29